MNWYRARIKVGSKMVAEYTKAHTIDHARVQLCDKFGSTLAYQAQIENLGTPVFRSFKVIIHFRNRIEQVLMLAIEKEHVQSKIYSQYRHREIIKLIIHGKDDYGGPEEVRVSYRRRWKGKSHRASKTGKNDTRTRGHYNKYQGNIYTR